MHYGALVIFSSRPKELDSAMESVMRDGKDIYWDWYQIGGRWTGTLSGYDPDSDPANIEVCGFCNGTGNRPDMDVANGCNGCQGKGKHVKWPTQWAKHPGDIVPVSQLTGDAIEKNFLYVVLSDHGFFSGERYEPWRTEDKFAKTDLPPLSWIKQQYKDGIAVVVDCHN
jgi:hypothetical protein